jgi:uncharacterized protein YgiB involved in biofilm formation
MRHSSGTARALALSVAALALAGCGGGTKKTAEPPPFKGIYTASGDCADSGKLSIDQCLEAMEKAVAEHEKSAPSYGSLKSCEATEGMNRCERTHVGKYRPVLLAFLVTASKTPSATPLYASGDPKKVGFRSAAKEFYLVGDEAVPMSQHAHTLAEAAVDKKAKSKGGFGS